MQVNVLDHGYVTLVETWGSDERIVEAARMSTNKGFQGWGPCHTVECKSHAMDKVYDAPDEFIFANKCDCPHDLPGDEKLLRYLYEHKHMTPFEMAGMIIEVQAPIFVFREWHRHRTQSYNEMSARYIPLPDVNYVPSVERLLQGSSSQNKQQQAVAGVLSTSGAEGAQGLLVEIYGMLEHSYQMMLGNGVPKELARLILPVGRYSRMRASANLRNWLAFLPLRMDPAAQWEIRQYAGAVADLIAVHFPRTWALFNVTGPHIIKGKP